MYVAKIPPNLCSPLHLNSIPETMVQQTDDWFSNKLGLILDSFLLE